MPITLVTGLPGHGKTLYTLARFKDEAEKAGRRVFYSGIPDLKVPGWEEFDVEKWEDLPAGSLCILDEAQFKFPTRGRGTPPPHVEKLATHRHLGLDFVLITQNPMLIDSFVRRLVDRHFHVVRKFGTHFATIHEFVNGAKDNVEKSREGSIRHEWRYPKDVFEWYKSAEVHTVKRRIPAKVWVLATIPVVLAGTIWFAWQRLNPDSVAERTTGAEAISQAEGPGIRQPGTEPSVAVSTFDLVSPGQYLQARMPRFAGLPHTAPIYDELTKPSVVPVPAACVSNGDRCQCYTQQATKLSVPDDVCRQIVLGGYFVDWGQGQGAEPRRSELIGAADAELRPAGRPGV